MKTIYKFPIEPGVTRIMAPGWIRPLHVAIQHGDPTLWCMVDTEQPTRVHEVHAVGTGRQIERPPHEYVDTFHQNGLVWHVFMASSGNIAIPLTQKSEKPLDNPAPTPHDPGMT